MLLPSPCVEWKETDTHYFYHVSYGRALRLLSLLFILVDSEWCIQYSSTLKDLSNSSVLREMCEGLANLAISQIY